jgi:hypothetical protein
VENPAFEKFGVNGFRIRENDASSSAQNLWSRKKKFFFVPKKSPVSLFIGLIGLDSHAPFFLPLFPNN